MKGYEYMRVDCVDLQRLRELGRDGWEPSANPAVFFQHTIGEGGPDLYSGLLQRQIEGHPESHRVVSQDGLRAVYVALSEGEGWYIEDPTRPSGYAMVLRDVLIGLDCGSARRGSKSIPPLPRATRDRSPDVRDVWLLFTVREEAMCAAQRLVDGRPVFPLYPLDPREPPP